MDKHGNFKALEGCDRCGCGCKYWEKDVCVSCGEPFTEWDGNFTPEQQAFYDEVEANTDNLFRILGITA